MITGTSRPERPQSASPSLARPWLQEYQPTNHNPSSPGPMRGVRGASADCNDVATASEKPGDESDGGAAGHFMTAASSHTDLLHRPKAVHCYLNNALKFTGFRRATSESSQNCNNTGNAVNPHSSSHQKLVSRILHAATVNGGLGALCQSVCRLPLCAALTTLPGLSSTSTPGV